MVEDVILNSLLMKGMAFAGSEEPRVLLTTTIIPIMTMDAFFFYILRMTHRISH